MFYRLDTLAGTNQQCTSTEAERNDELASVTVYICCESVAAVYYVSG